MHPIDMSLCDCDCKGATVEFRGLGKDRQYRICPNWKEPGHLTEAEIKKAIGNERGWIMPHSGRFA